jgi:hypothetical protein
MTLAEVGYPVYVILPQTYMTLVEVGYPVYVILPQTYMTLEPTSTKVIYV